MSRFGTIMQRSLLALRAMLVVAVLSMALGSHFGVEAAHHSMPIHDDYNFQIAADDVSPTGLMASHCISSVFCQFVFPAGETVLAPRVIGDNPNVVPFSLIGSSRPNTLFRPPRAA